MSGDGLTQDERDRLRAEYADGPGRLRTPDERAVSAEKLRAFLAGTAVSRPIGGALRRTDKVDG